MKTPTSLLSLLAIPFALAACTATSTGGPDELGTDRTVMLEIAQADHLAGQIDDEDASLDFEVERTGGMLHIQVEGDDGDLLEVVAEAGPTGEGSMAAPIVRLHGETVALDEAGHITTEDRQRLTDQEWSALERLGVEVESAAAEIGADEGMLGQAIALTVEQLETEVPQDAEYLPTCSTCYNASSYTWWVHACFLLPCAY